MIGLPRPPRGASALGHQTLAQLRVHRRPAVLVVLLHEARQQVHEPALFHRVQRRDHAPLAALEQGYHPLEQPCAFVGDVKLVAAAIAFRTFARDEAPRLQPVEHLHHRGLVEGDEPRQPHLVDARHVADDAHRGELHRGDAQRTRFLLEQALRDLVEPADQMGGPGVECVERQAGLLG